MTDFRTGSTRRSRARRVAVAGTVAVAVLLVAALWQRGHPFSIQSSVRIDASQQQVWTTLTDFASYPDWNPALLGMSGALTDGGTLSYRDSGGERVTPTVLAVEPGTRLSWKTSTMLPGVFDGERSFTLDSLPDGSTRLTQTELFRGVAVPFLTASLLDETAPSFHDMNAALRERLEG